MCTKLCTFPFPFCIHNLNSAFWHSAACHQRLPQPSPLPHLPLYLFSPSSSYGNQCSALDLNSVKPTAPAQLPGLPLLITPLLSCSLFLTVLPPSHASSCGRQAALQTPPAAPWQLCVLLVSTVGFVRRPQSNPQAAASYPSPLTTHPSTRPLPLLPAAPILLASSSIHSRRRILLFRFVEFLFFAIASVVVAVAVVAASVVAVAVVAALLFS